MQSFGYGTRPHWDVTLSRNLTWKDVESASEILKLSPDNSSQQAPFALKLKGIRFPSLSSNQSAESLFEVIENMLNLRSICFKGCLLDSISCKLLFLMLENGKEFDQIVIEHVFFATGAKAVFTLGLFHYMGNLLKGELKMPKKFVILGPELELPSLLVQKISMLLNKNLKTIENVDLWLQECQHPQKLSPLYFFGPVINKQTGAFTIMGNLSQLSDFKVMKTMERTLENIFLFHSLGIPQKIHFPKLSLKFFDLSVPDMVLLVSGLSACYSLQHVLMFQIHAPAGAWIHFWREFKPSREKLILKLTQCRQTRRDPNYQGHSFSEREKYYSLFNFWANRSPLIHEVVFARSFYGDLLPPSGLRETRTVAKRMRASGVTFS